MLNKLNMIKAPGLIGIAWLAIGIIMGFLDILDLIQFGAITQISMQCALKGAESTACLPNAINTIILFIIDIFMAPIYILLAIVNLNIPGIIGTIIILGTVFYMSIQYK